MNRQLFILSAECVAKSHVAELLVPDVSIRNDYGYFIVATVAGSMHFTIEFLPIKRNVLHRVDQIVDARMNLSCLHCVINS